jgi:hypothetical protein
MGNEERDHIGIVVCEWSAGDKIQNCCQQD